MKVFDLPYDASGIFKVRENRFTGIVDIVYPVKMRDVPVHIHDSGRLGEILFEGNRVYLRRADTKNSKRKTKWDLIAGDVKGNIVFTNSMYHRNIALWSFKNLDLFRGRIVNVQPEFPYGNSRLDFLVETESERFLIETKGCTLGIDNAAVFPDAPTERGRRHVKELLEAAKEFKKVIIFLVFVPWANCFYPNEDTDPGFSHLFFTAIRKGVKSIQLQFRYDGRAIYYLKELPICRKSPFSNFK